MNLLVIRHAIAEDKEVFARTGRGDDQRPLTDLGRSKMRRVASGLRVLVPRLATLASSPLLRARETAEIVAPSFKVPRVEIVEALRPDQPFDAFLDWLRERAEPNDDSRTIAIVGHEPHLGGLVTWLMTRTNESRLELKKGAACLLHFADSPPDAGAAVLRWALTPSNLRQIGE
jgi:phosphohistidine phosphatase